ncbi:MAG TPA: peroxiredoxin, partial [Candidatus Limnocylindria bacterium]|nr:peroxiredoxin [Candidatus Limnocylindria bacterium]
MSRPNLGDAAPAFRMTADDGQLVSTESLAGTRFVLYFYPKDDTPGCTRQACSLRDNWEQMLATGAEIFGVSPDSVASHVKFRAKYDLPYRLLSD